VTGLCRLSATSWLSLGKPSDPPRCFKPRIIYLLVWSAFSLQILSSQLLFSHPLHLHVCFCIVYVADFSEHPSVFLFELNSSEGDQKSRFAPPCPSRVRSFSPDGDLVRLGPLSDFSRPCCTPHIIFSRLFFSALLKPSAMPSHLVVAPLAGASHKTTSVFLSLCSSTCFLLILLRFHYPFSRGIDAIHGAPPFVYFPLCFQPFLVKA